MSAMNEWLVAFMPGFVAYYMYLDEKINMQLIIVFQVCWVYDCVYPAFSFISLLNLPTF